jgi:hypothetical protein
MLANLTPLDLALFGGYCAGVGMAIANLTAILETHPRKPTVLEWVGMVLMTAFWPVTTLVVNILKMMKTY